MSLPEAIRRGMEALQRNEPVLAANELASVFDNPEFIAANDLLDIRSRVGSLLGQAYLEAGRPEKADRPLREAQRIARELGDTNGVAIIEALRSQVMSLLADRLQQQDQLAERQRIGKQPLDKLLEGLESPELQVDRLLQRAQFEIDSEQFDLAVSLSSQALDIARRNSSIRNQVLAHLSLARAVPQKAETELGLALALATEANEFNLVGAISKAAQAHGIPLPTLPFAGRSIQ